MSEDEFLEDPRTIDAVVRNFEVMGEAAKRISEETRHANPAVPWRDFARFRDVLIHRYDESCREKCGASLASSFREH